MTFPKKYLLFVLLTMSLLEADAISMTDVTNEKATWRACYMQEAIAMAKQSPLYPFGAVIVDRTTGAIIARGVNRVKSNPLLHGEIDAINNAATVLKHPVHWSDFDLYTTAEPCPMCQSAIEWAGISRVYYGVSIPYLKHIGMPQIDIRADEISRKTPFNDCVLMGGILEKECRSLFERHRE